MVRFRPLLVGFLALLVVAGAAPCTVLAAQPIGAARLVVADVSAQSPAAIRLLATDDTVAYQELIATQRGAAAVIVFVDGTELAVGERAEVRLDDFVFDPGAAGALTLSLQSGALRFATGSMRKDAYRIETPSAALTVRGTRFDLAVVDGATYLRVLEGEVDVTGLNGETKAVGVGQSVNVTAAGVPGAPAPMSAVSGTLADMIGRMDTALAEALPDAPPASLSSLSVLSQARSKRATIDSIGRGKGHGHPDKGKKGGKL